MKKTLKFLTVLFALVLLSCAVAFTAMANGAEALSSANGEDENESTAQTVQETELKLKVNLTLSSKFTYNVYISKDDYENVTSVKLDGEAYVPTETTLSGDPYYIISRDIPVLSSDEKFTVGFEYNGEPLSYEFSIPEYLEKVLASDPTNEARTLVIATQNYLNAFHNFISDTDEKPASAEHYPGEAVDSSAVKTVVTHASLLLDNKISFAFTLNGEAKNKTVQFSVNGYDGERTFTARAKDFAKGFYAIELPVKDLMLDIKISVTLDSGETATAVYNIDSYIHSVHNTMAENTRLRTLVNAIAAYSTAAVEYAITDENETPAASIKICGNTVNASDYAVVAETEAQKKAARILITAIGRKTGVTLKFAEEMPGYKKAIRFTSASANSTYDCNITTSSGDLIISSVYPSFFTTATEEFIDDYIKTSKTNIEFASNFTQKYTATRIFYSDFGAVGDGITDDFFAIKAAHEAANSAKRYTVYADEGKTYYIHETRKNGTGTPTTIVIKTNTVWTGARFIIDDSDISTFDGTDRATKHIFEILPDTTKQTITDSTILKSVLAAGLNRETTKIDLGLNKRVMIMPANSSHKVFRHRAYGDWKGVDMSEVIVLDEKGNVDPETRLIFDYKNLNKIDVYSMYDTPITIVGGEITTRASHIDITYKENGSTKYHDSTFSRGMSIKRSCTTIKNVKHYVEGEITLKEQRDGMVGPGYKGFFTITYSSHVTLDSCVLSGRRCYKKATGGTTGTYAMSGIAVNKLVFRDCVQQNFWVKVDENGDIHSATEDTPGVQLSMGTAEITGRKMHWGCGGTNFCKNMEFYNSVLSRFDAHSGLYNGKIIDSTVNYIALTGVGDMTIRNTRWFAEEDNSAANSLIHLREDYGSTWEGTITIDGMDAYVFTRGNKANNYSGTSTYLVYHKYTNWYFGYTTYFPSLNINNLNYYDIKTREKLPAGFEVKLCDGSVIKEPALHLSKTVNSHPLRGTTQNGKLDSSSYENLNIVTPPENIKITGNDGGYVYLIPNTGTRGKESDGGYYDKIENYGGFFGDTRFWYGDGKNDYYLGTEHVGKNTNTFKFVVGDSSYN